MLDIDTICNYFRHLDMTPQLVQKILEAGFQFRIETYGMKHKQFGNESGCWDALDGGMYAYQKPPKKIIICDDAQNYPDAFNQAYPPEKNHSLG